MSRNGPSVVTTVLTAVVSYGLVVAGVLAADSVLDWPGIDGSAWRVAGIVLAVLGLTLAVVAGRSLTRVYMLTGRLRGGPPMLVKWGLYGRMRHPATVGMTVALMGSALAVGSVMLLLTAVVSFVLGVVITIPREERELHRLYDEDYERYRAQVPAWFPRREPYQQAPELAAEPLMPS
jgi:protein-S-isoprenylcysteine O-methyltransferase Ste14